MNIVLCVASVCIYEILVRTYVYLTKYEYKECLCTYRVSKSLLNAATMAAATEAMVAASNKQFNNTRHTATTTIIVYRMK